MSSLNNSSSTTNYIDYETNSNQFFGKGFAHWDSVFFMRIAKVGYYEYENFFAFFPLFPFSVRYLTLFVVQPVREFLFSGSQLHHVDDYVISGVLISNICFIISVYVFIKLTKELFGNNWKLIKISTLLYIINPATVFMSVAYTESMFSLFSLLGMYFHAKKRHVLSCLFFCLATATRGNGIALCGFYIYQFIFDQFNLWKNRKSEDRISKLFKYFLFDFVKYIIVGCASVMLPYLLFQYYGYISFCTAQNGLSSPIGKDYISKYHPWCQSTLPHLYGYVQSKYWNVGLFKYYEFKQIPNFLLASPMILISLTAIYQYFSHDKMRFISIGLFPTHPQEKSLFETNNQIFVY
ncbi:predicted protein, partial [Naegleria gruberi]